MTTGKGSWLVAFEGQIAPYPRRNTKAPCLHRLSHPFVWIAGRGGWAHWAWEMNKI